MMRLQYLFDIVCSIPQTIYFNLRFLPLRKAIWLPFFVRHGTEIQSGGRVELSDSLDRLPFVIKIGNRGSDGVQTTGRCCFCLTDGVIKFEVHPTNA